MVMVTHDVGLKNFAHRVVRMADGKVNKIQTVDEHARNDLIKELNSRVQAIKSGSFKDQLMIREGIVVKPGEEIKRIPDNYRVVLDASNATKTSVRQPRDYPVLGARFASK